MDLDERTEPTRIHPRAFDDLAVEMVAAGFAHAAAVTKDGGVWTWGSGSEGQLGQGHFSDMLEPARVGFDKAFDACPVVVVACGGAHTLAVTREGVLWSWGLGENGVLGHDDEADRLHPTRVCPRYFANAKVAVASAGAEHTLALTQDGDLYSWGPRWQTVDSQAPTGLGQGDGEDRHAPARIPEHHLGGARVGRCRSLPLPHALAFTMALHPRLGAASVFQGLLDELAKQILQLSCSWPEGPAGQEDKILRLLGGARCA